MLLFLAIKQAMTFVSFTESCVTPASGFRGDAAWRRLTFPTLGTVVPWLPWGPRLPACTPNLGCSHGISRQLSESMLLSGAMRIWTLSCLLISALPCAHACALGWTLICAPHTCTSVSFPKSFIFLTKFLQPQFLAYILFFLMPHPMIPFPS